MSSLHLTDLSDARRANKTWLPDDDGDVTTGLVLQDEASKPACRRHGAMNRVHPVEHIYRCSEFRCGVGARVADRRP
ncbi:hypothetical protein [Pseudonocardia sp. TRM90224]|uniref:hypothetical protein n=1 Tax=Pseudonocardia sp. TRM90224 TaxID=2812678 RepID=UPI0035A8FB1D